MADEKVMLGHGSGGSMMKRIIDEVRAALDEAKEAMEDDAKDAAGFTVARV